ncbi:hypothetical protein L915_01097 [Phytophthora nicotianae]|uniref:Uncharacterized protein n=1 Tax=Phytophthora nicotianae TaxID=4792 RepID=W2HNC7_PHYNI|nr:hypothetical protein L915_01097 [Phytophthora nicotianae]ETL49441.1 hypothetical protein L916_01081 [Phytophthora nicotianae]ETM55745.1 hypothetical protein L914_01090 [Phytophthora nicotianae]
MKQVAISKLDSIESVGVEIELTQNTFLTFGDF